MDVVEIVLILIGIAVFILSFVLPEKKGVLSQETVKLSEETIKKLVEEEMKGVREKVEETIDETVSYAIEKTERSMERLSNEKIMAVNEYSDTVLSEIHKNHEEVVFLYDMLNDKQKSIKQVVGDAEKIRQEVEKTNNDMIKSVVKMQETADKETASDVERNLIKETSLKGKTAVKTHDEQPADEEKASNADFTPFVVEKLEAPKKTTKKTSAKAVKKPVTATSETAKKNKNEMILSMHEEGKSNMAIAKELSLGIGEVKLIIDLYKGGLK